MQLDQIGPYRIEEQLGEGPHGESYRATESVTGRMVVLKMIRRDLFSSRTDLDQFLAFAKRLTSISHPNLATVFGVDLTDESICLAHEFVEGSSIRELIEPDLMDPRQVLSLGIQIVAGVKALHGRGLSHGHISTDNVMVTQSGEVKLLDFGLPILGPGYDPDEPAIPNRIPVWISDEGAPPADADSDLFALGSLFYEMLTGRSPFSEEPEQTTRALSVMSREIRLMIEKLLSSDRDEQFVNIDELFATITEIHRYSEEPPEPVDEKPQSTRPYVIISLIAFTLLVIWWAVTTFYK
jgi:eukaryotic-like serine/threonine-protein kinase